MSRPESLTRPPLRSSSGSGAAHTSGNNLRATGPDTGRSSARYRRSATSLALRGTRAHVRSRERRAPNDAVVAHSANLAMNAVFPQRLPSAGREQPMRFDRHTSDIAACTTTHAPRPTELLPRRHAGYCDIYSPSANAAALRHTVALQLSGRSTTRCPRRGTGRECSRSLKRPPAQPSTSCARRRGSRSSSADRQAHNRCPDRSHSPDTILTGLSVRTQTQQERNQKRTC